MSLLDLTHMKTNWLPMLICELEILMVSSHEVVVRIE